MDEDKLYEVIFIWRGEQYRRIGTQKDLLETMQKDIPPESTLISMEQFAS
jgi:hypothetical protein